MLSDDDVNHLRALLSAVEFGHETVPEGPEPYVMSGWGMDSVLFRGEALGLLARVERSLGRDALDGGPAETAVRNDVIQACRLARENGSEAAEEWLRDRLGRELSLLCVVVECHDWIGEREVLNVGACQILKTPPKHWQGIQTIPVGLTPPVIATEVLALDPESAVIAGLDRIDEARAILAVADVAPSRRWPGHVILDAASGDLARGQSERPDRHVVWGVVNQDLAYQDLHPGWNEVSAAARLAPERRTEWSRRTIAACRWYRRAVSTTWASEAVADAIAALEILLVQPGEPKRGTVASRAAQLFRTDAIPEEDQERWLKRAYEWRSGALHGGSVVTQDRDAVRLVALAGAACRWAIRHHNPMHREPEAVCATLTEVLDQSLHD